MKSRCVHFVITAALFIAIEAQAQKAVILVRHAERLDQSRDTPLSAAGTERAQSLSRLLKDAGVTAIYTTELQRTVKTAEPLAALLKIKPIVVSADNLDELIARIKRENVNDVVFVVGHSNTVPDLINAFGASAKVTIPDPEYDNLFIVTPQAGRPAVLLRLRF